MMMRYKGLMLAAAIGMAALQGFGQAPVITSFPGNGQLSWTNAVNSNALFRVEWAAQPGGPWYRTFDNIGGVDGLSATGFSVGVPMVYRVVMATNQPPQGMVWIDGGEFTMGDVQGVGYTNERPLHVNFVSGFWMDEMEVSKSKWDQVYNWAITNGYTFSNTGSGKTNSHPVQIVNWYDSVKWCNARSQKEGLTPCYYADTTFTVVYKAGTNALGNSNVNWAATGYRLPTEAEWEKAARGARQGRLFPWGGDTIQQTRANYYSTNVVAYDTNPTGGYTAAYNDGLPPYTSPPGSFPANGYGLHDMTGNVWEWCWDWFGVYASSYQTDPKGGSSGTYRMLRGGSWGWSAFYGRVCFRNYDLPASAYYDVGFRAVCGGNSY